MKHSSVLVTMYKNIYYATGPQFDFEVDKVYLTFHLVGIDKMSTKMPLELNTESPALGLLPDQDTSYYTSPQGP